MYLIDSYYSFVAVGVVLSPLKTPQLIGVMNKLTVRTPSEGPSIGKWGATLQDGTKTDAVPWLVSNLCSWWAVVSSLCFSIFLLTLAVILDGLRTGSKPSPDRPGFLKLCQKLGNSDMTRFQTLFLGRLHNCKCFVSIKVVMKKSLSLVSTVNHLDTRSTCDAINATTFERQSFY